MYLHEFNNRRVTPRYSDANHVGSTSSSVRVTWFRSESNSVCNTRSVNGLLNCRTPTVDEPFVNKAFETGSTTN